MTPKVPFCTKNGNYSGALRARKNGTQIDSLLTRIVASAFCSETTSLSGLFRGMHASCRQGGKGAYRSVYRVGAVTGW